MTEVPIITLTTDFGEQDGYVGAMKGVILSQCPQAHILDITHDIPAQKVRFGAFVIQTYAPYFPPGTIHVAVVDPGVGSFLRRGIVIVSGDHFFIGPDNGLFSLILEHPVPAKIFELTDSRYFLPQVSSTFHGRDIFSSVAGHLALGIPAEAFGPPVFDPVILPEIGPKLSSGKKLLGEVIHVDHFGNLITNLSRDSLFSVKFLNELSKLSKLGEEEKEGLLKRVRIKVKRKMIQGIHRCYAEVPRGKIVALFGSMNLLEISVNCGNASEKIGVGEGEPVYLMLT